MTAAGAKDEEMRHFDAEQVFLEANVAEGYQDFPRDIKTSLRHGVVEKYLRARTGRSTYSTTTDSRNQKRTHA